MSIKQTFLNHSLYNYRIKKIINNFLNQPQIYRNIFYQNISKLQINHIIQKYKSRPFSIRIENTNHCNAKCYMCPHSTMKRKQGIMSRKLYKKIIDEAIKIGVENINLHNFGEPLIDPNFIWRIQYAKKSGIKKISTNTNGQLLTRDLARKIIDSGLDEIYFSVDANSDDIYKKIRIGLNFTNVVNNIKYLSQLKKKLRQQKPRIIIDFLETDINKHQIKQFINHWKKIVNHVCISQLHDWSNKKNTLINSTYQNFVTFSCSPCKLPFTEILINWDGSISLCCQDIENEIILGNANKQTIISIWNNKKYSTIRKKHRNLNINNLYLCNNCKLRTFWWSS